MRAITMEGFGGPEVLRSSTRPTPVPQAGEVLVRVHAAGVNRVDVLQRTGLYVPQPGTTDIPGVELAGEVVAAASGAGRYRVGDRVCGIVVGGGYAELCAVPEGQLLPVPAGCSDVQAAALTEALCTVWNALFDQGRLQPGESLLVHGGSSGIGTTAIMLARAMGIGPVFATAGSAEKCAACEALGARAINYRTEDFVAAIKDATAGRGVDVVLDMVAGDYVPRNIAVLADDGRLVFVGRMSQGLDVNVNVTRIMYARLSVTGISLRGQSLARKAAIVAQVERRVWPLVADGTFAPVIDSVFDLADAEAAHRRLETSQHIGKIVLRVATP